MVDQDLYQAMEILGKKKGRVTEQERSLYRSWMAAGMSPEILFYAAECAASGDNPYALLQYLMEQWRQKGITTVRDAKKEQKGFAQGKKGKSVKGAAAKQFEQRAEQPQDLFEQF